MDLVVDEELFATETISSRTQFLMNKHPGTVTGHCLSFVKATLDEMDKYPEMKGHYLVMDNAPIHSSTGIGKYIHSRGYGFVYLPPYFPELNPIEQF
ncbi:hypothetical protein G6F70_009565 [Rhizopus microsporus]|nr:hypothetical protein G6F71_009591 [Rhizopus microsporus]KAG1187467.1 hypothetical protein G6F70_009565 [Rhizopus microsporus]KAG1205037.1 hypothetical protein G6F69_009536 [Rhizopus microsporus]KAG1223637.1 hypothetical protein G6F67_009620 [Rhizopus microsporus]KAG1241713.1 hypothetical protein G6F68_016539 [Rhizopus microsporus]